jgi:hypothetical protein
LHDRYADKYLLAEFAVKSASASLVASLEALGLTAGGLKKMRKFVAEGSTVTLRLNAEEFCDFKEKTVSMPSP